MRPYSNLRSGHIAPENIQTLVPGVQLLIVGTLEARPTKAKSLYIVAEVSLHHPVRDMRCIWHVLGSQSLAAQRRRAERTQQGFHCPPSSIADALRDLRRPRVLGRSRSNGL